MAVNKISVDSFLTKKGLLQKAEQNTSDVLSPVIVEHICNKDTLSKMRYTITLMQGEQIITLNASMIKSINKVINQNWKDIIKGD